MGLLRGFAKAFRLNVEFVKWALFSQWFIQIALIYYLVFKLNLEMVGIWCAKVTSEVF